MNKLLIGIAQRLVHKAIEGAKAYDNYVIDNNLEHTLNFK